MRNITGAFWIVGRGCVVTVDYDDGYFVGQAVDIMDGDKFVIRTAITGIEMMRGIKLGKPRGLQLRNVPKDLIKQNMAIQKVPPV
jgi:translation elongation factor EF-Tu-like GTPase